MNAAGPARSYRPRLTLGRRCALAREDLAGRRLFGRAHLTIALLLIGFFGWVLWQLVPMLRAELFDLVAGSIVRGGR